MNPTHIAGWTKLNREDIINLADSLYWEFVERYGEKSKFVVNSFHDGGTVNTEEGSRLYYSIEDILFEATGVSREQ